MNLLPRSLASWTVELERQFGSLSSDTLSLDRPEFELELESGLGSEFDVEFEFELGCEFEFELEFDRRAYGGRKNWGALFRADFLKEYVEKPGTLFLRKSFLFPREM